MDHLSASQLLTFEMCGHLYSLRYVEGIKFPRNDNMIRGSNVDKARNSAMRKRLETGELPGLEEVQDVTATIAHEEWESGEIVIPEGASAQGLKDEIKDSSIRLAVCDRTELQPGIIPAAVQRRAEIKIDGLPPIVVISDLDDTSSRVHELKAGGPKSTFPVGTADASEQITVYALEVAVNEGLPIVEARLEKVRDLKTGPRAGVQNTVRNQSHMQAILNRFAIMQRSIEAGIFMPASNQFSWKCKKDQCEAWAVCPYVSDPVTVAMPGKAVEDGD